MVKRLILLMIVAVAFAVAPTRGSAQQEGTARVRIGYFAFDPRTVDTYIDGELASFSDGWAYAGWNEAPFPEFQFVRTKFTTPLVELPAGAHSFAFVPKGEDVGAAILGPNDVVLEAGHVVVLAIVGHDGKYDLATSDETVALANGEPGDQFIFNFVHNLKGGPPIDQLTNDLIKIENLAYGDVATTTEPAGPANLLVTATGDRNTVFMNGGAVAPANVANFAAIFGEYPGTPGVDYFLTYDWAHFGEIAVRDGGSVAVGDVIPGAIEETAQRVRYTLTLEDDAVLSVYVRATGDRSPDSWETGPFDSSLMIYDADGKLLFWNDELSVADNAMETLNAFDAGLEGVTLAAGIYVVEVAGSVDIIAGPYELVIENAMTE